MPDLGIDFSNPETKRALIFFLAGLGRSIGQGQGVAEMLGGGTQNLIKAQNLRNLVESLKVEPSALAAAPAKPTTAQGPSVTGEAGKVGGPKGVASKITFEGSDMSDIGKILSGINIQETPSPTGISNFLLPR